MQMTHIYTCPALGFFPHSQIAVMPLCPSCFQCRHPTIYHYPDEASIAFTMARIIPEAQTSIAMGLSLQRSIHSFIYCTWSALFHLFFRWRIKWSLSCTIWNFGLPSGLAMGTILSRSWCPPIGLVVNCGSHLENVPDSPADFFTT